MSYCISNMLRVLTFLVGFCTLAATASAQVPNLRLLISDFTKNRILRYDGATGSFLNVLVTSGSGGLNQPQNLQIGPDGKLYVSSHATGRVKRYDEVTGAFLGNFVHAGSGGLSSPDQLAFGPDGNLYVSDRFVGRILRYNGTTGASLGTFVSDFRLSGFVAFTFGPDGHIYASMFNPIGGLPQCILRYNGQSGAFMNVFACPQANDFSSAFGGLAFGPDGHLYASRFHHGEVWQIDENSGAFLKALHCPGDTNADYVVFGPDGKLYLNTQSKNISYFNVKTGKCLGTFLHGSALSSSKGFVFDASVGGVVSTLSLSHVRCTNLTTGQVVAANVQGKSWDCEALGLDVQAGDKINMRVQGDAQEGP